MADGWIDGFERVSSAHGNGGSYVPNVVFRWIGHTVEGFSKDPAAQAAAHPTPPHCWVTLPSHPYSPRRRIQIVPLTRSAFALKHNRGDPETNKAGAIQVEIEGFSSGAAGWSTEDLDWLADQVVGPMCAEVGVDTSLWYPTNVVRRMSWGAWASYGGLCCHRNVPGNTHVDAPIDLAYIAHRLSAPNAPPPTPPILEDDDMQKFRFVRAVDRGEVYLLGQDLRDGKKLMQSEARLMQAADYIAKNADQVLPVPPGETADTVAGQPVWVVDPGWLDSIDAA